MKTGGSITGQFISAVADWHQRYNNLELPRPYGLGDMPECA